MNTERDLRFYDSVIRWAPVMFSASAIAAAYFSGMVPFSATNVLSALLAGFVFTFGVLYQWKNRSILSFIIFMTCLYCSTRGATIMRDFAFPDALSDPYRGSLVWQFGFITFMVLFGVLSLFRTRIRRWLHGAVSIEFFTKRLCAMRTSRSPR